MIEAHLNRDEMTVPTALLIVSEEGTLISANGCIAELLGLQNQDTTGVSVSEFFEDCDFERCKSELEDLVRQNRILTKFCVGIDARGDRIPLKVFIAEHRTLRSREYIAICEDQRGRYDNDQQREQLRKLSSLGRLVGGIAHDFNNLLTAILGHAELAAMKLPEGSPARLHIEQIMTASNRATALTDQLLLFARKRELRREVFNASALAKRVVEMIGRIIPEDTTLKLETSDVELPVLVDGAQLENALLNLVSNAVDALPNGGTITVRTELVTQPRKLARILIIDDGVGMDQETLAHVFEPFFTTKPAHKGTGLGLSIAISVIEQFGGQLSLRTEVGGGTEAQIDLPIADDVTSAVVTMQESHPDDEPTGTETILLVEDDTDVLSVTSSTLLSLGYHVLRCAKPSEAIAIAGQSSERIHLLITDVVMPEMNGANLAEEITKLRPGIKVLFVSGYLGNITEKDALRLVENNLVQKPFTRRNLASAVRERLDRGSGS